MDIADDAALGMCRDGVQAMPTWWPQNKIQNSIFIDLPKINKPTQNKLNRLV